MRKIATIRTAIQIQDNMSSAFQSMNTAMNVVLSSFESLQTASGQAVDTNSIQLARQELMRAETAFNGIKQEIRQASEAQQRLTNDVRNGTNAANQAEVSFNEIEQEIRQASGAQQRLNSDVRSGANAANQAEVSFNEIEQEIRQASEAQQRLTNDVRNGSSAASQAEMSFNNVEQEIRQAGEAQQRFNNDVRDGASAADNLLGKIVGIATAYLSFRTGKGIIGLSDEMANTTARLNMMNDDLQTTAELQQMIFDSAQRSYGAYADTADLVGKIGMNAGDAFGSTKEVVAYAELLNKQFGIAGTNVEGIQGATLQLIQALGSGSLKGQELNSVLLAAPNIIETIADYLEVPKGSIKELAAEGVITAEIMKQAMFAAADDINSEFESMPLTFAQLWTNFKSDALWAFQPVLQGLNDIANNEKFLEFVNNITNSLYTLSAVAMGVFDVMTSSAGFVFDNWSIIGPVISDLTFIMFGYATALGAVKLAEMAAFTWKALNTTATLIYAAAMGAGTGATWSMVAAAWGLNAALAANPIFIVIMAIAVLIGIIYAVVGAINHFAGTSISATGLIAGSFAVMGAFIANVFLGLLQIVFGVIEYLVNGWIDFANFFGNVLNDPVGAIIHLFGDLGDNVLGVIEKIASALDFVFGLNLASAVSGWRNELAGLVDWAAKEYGNGEYEVLYDNLDMDSVLADLGVNLDRFEYKNAWDAGNDWGANLFNNDPRETQKGNSFEDLMSGLGGVMGPLASDGKDTAKNTAKMAKTMEASEEDLKYLRDLAERDVINRFTTAEVKVDFSSVNTINSDLDLDGIIDQFAEKLEEALDVAAEGA